jgi:hypothetical protein
MTKPKKEKKVEATKIPLTDEEENNDGDDFDRSEVNGLGCGMDTFGD